MPIKYMDLEGLQPGERAFRTGLLLTNPKAHAVELQAEAQMRDRMQQIKPMEAAHFLLDGIGMVPVLGELADALNGFLYLFEGDKVNVGFSFAATAPLAGIGATGAKWAKNAVTYSKKSSDETVDLVHSAIRKRDGVAKGKFVKDYATKNTKNFSSYFKSEREARNLARTKIGKNPIEVELNKWRSADGKWQHRAKAGDVNDKHSIYISKN